MAYEEENINDDTADEPETYDWKYPRKGIIYIKDTGEILDASYDAVCILGLFDSDSIKGDELNSYVYTEYEERINSDIRRTLETSRTCRSYVSLMGPDREVVKTRLTLTPYLNDATNKKLIVYIEVLDVQPPGTELRDVRYNKAMESLKNFVGSDMAGGNESPESEPDHNVRILEIDYNGTILSWNAFLERYFGYTRDEAVGKKRLFDLLSPGQTGGANVILKSALSGEKDFRSEMKFVPRQGRTDTRSGMLEIVRGLERKGKNGGYICMFYPIDEDEDEYSKPDEVEARTAGEPTAVADDIPVADVLFADAIYPSIAEVPTAEPVEEPRAVQPDDFREMAMTAETDRAAGAAPSSPGTPATPADPVNQTAPANSTAPGIPDSYHTPETPDMAIVGSDGHIKFITENFVQKLGFESFEEIKEHNWFEFMTVKPNTESACEPTRVPCRTREGTTVDTDLQVIPLPDEGGQFKDALWLLNRRDDEKDYDPLSREPAGPPAPGHAESALMQLNQDLVALNIIANVIDQYVNFNDMTDAILDTISGVISVEYSALYSVANGRVHLESAVGLDNARAHEAVVVDNDPENSLEIIENAFKAGVKSIIRSCMTIPIKSNGITYGYMAFASSSPMDFEKMDMEFLNTISHMMASAVQRNTLLQEYRAASADYTGLYEDTPDMYINIDKNGVIRSCNRRTYEVSGQDKKALVNKNILEIVKRWSKSDHKKFTAWLRTAEGSDRTPGMDLQVKFGSGQEHYYNVTAWPWDADGSGVTDGIRLALRDTTLYHRARSYHRSSEELMDQIFNATNDLVMYIDTTRTIIECNNSSEELLGYERNDLRGQPLNMLYTNDLLMDRYFEDIEAIYTDAEKGREITHEQVLRRKDGSMFLAMVTACSVRNNKGAITGIALYVADITNRKRQEKELLEARRETTFYTNILSEDVRTYMERARSYIKMLKGSALEDTQKDIVNMIMDQVESNIRLSDNVKKLSSIKEDGPPLSTVDLDRVLRKTAHEILESSYIRGGMGDIEISFSYPEGFYGVKADTLIDDLFSNIFWNAVTHNVHEKKTVDISIKIPEDHGDAYWQIEITDNAYGIPDETKAVICDPNTEAKGDGSGIGLPIINALVKRYGGRIWVENRILDDHTKGSIFKLLLKKSRIDPTSTIYGTGARC